MGWSFIRDWLGQKTHFSSLCCFLGTSGKDLVSLKDMQLSYYLKVAFPNCL